MGWFMCGPISMWNGIPKKEFSLVAKGQMLKQISAEARKDIEDLVGSQVYLEIWVKVRPKWREKETELRQLGLSSDHRAY